MNDDTVYQHLCANLPKKKYSDRRVMISAPYMIPNIASFVKFLSDDCGIEVLVADVKERLEEHDLIKYQGQYDVALIGDDRYTAKILDQNANANANVNTSHRKILGLCKWGTGIDSIDLEAASRNGIKVLNTPDAFSEPVAESILGAMLSFNRTLLQSSYMMHTDKSSWAKVPGKTLSETTVSIVGFGNIGKAIARKLLLLNSHSSIGVPIKTYDIIPDILSKHKQNDAIFQSDKIEQVANLDDLLDCKPDFLIIACCQTKDNTAMISIQQLDKLGPNCVIINMARGRLVDEQALIPYLIGLDNNSSKIRGAALDVFWDEPWKSVV